MKIYKGLELKFLRDFTEDMKKSTLYNALLLILCVWVLSFWKTDSSVGPSNDIPRLTDEELKRKSDVLNGVY
jgi:hypothetical protein